MTCPDACSIGKFSCTLFYIYANAGMHAGLMACHSDFLCMGRTVCRVDFLHAGRVIMYTPTILRVSCMAKIDNIHEWWLLANIPTYIIVYNVYK